MPIMNRGSKSNARNSNSSFSLAIFDEADYYFEYDNGSKIKAIKNGLPT